MASSILHDLQWRGLIADVAHRDELERLLAPGAAPVTLYAGFDPTADSLHLGHLIGLLILRRFQMAGHRPIAVAGGATGMIGDPSGKSAERNLLSVEVLEGEHRRDQGSTGAVARFREQDESGAAAEQRRLGGADQRARFSARRGKTFFGQRDDGAGQREIADGERDQFHRVFVLAFAGLRFSASPGKQGCILQTGGADQWGNITAGIDLIRRKHDVTACGLTTPLLTKTDGTKFGKTEGGAVWLSPAKTSVYRFYQFLIQTEDAQVIQLLKYFTFLTQEEIAALEAQHLAAPERREAHKKLALELTRLVHGESATADAIRASEILFGGSLEGITQAQFDEVIAEVPHVTLARDLVGQPGGGLVEVLIAAGLSPSKGQARKDIEAGGVYVNNARAADAKSIIVEEQLLFGQFVLLRKGKRNYALVKFA